MDISPILKHIQPHIQLSQQDEELFVSLWKERNIKRRQLVDEPGVVSKFRTYVVSGSFRGYLIGHDQREHTISLAIEDWYISDPGSFFYQEPATLYVEALEDSVVLQLSYENELLLFEKIPAFEKFFRIRWQRIAIMVQRRIISNLSLTAEERYNEFTKKYPLFVQRIPLYIIASYLGMTREFLSKIRNQKINSKNRVN